MNPEFLLIVGLALLVAATIGLGAFFIRDAMKAPPVDPRIAANEWLNEVLPVVSDPSTELSVLRSLLAMENPHNAGFTARIQMLRVLSQNPALPPELQAAAITRISQEEATARLDRSLRRSRGGAGGFVGVSVPL